MDDGPNRVLQNILQARPDVTQATLREITGRGRTLVFGWLEETDSKHFKRIKAEDLRHIKLELGLATPRYANGSTQ